MTRSNKRTRMSNKDKRERELQRRREEEEKLCWYCDNPRMEGDRVCRSCWEQECAAARKTHTCDACMVGLHDVCDGCQCTEENSECDPWWWNRHRDEELKRGIR